ncbi:helix-turn-helix transcriptional regulator [Cohnella sp. LGH]|uniref:helix-turn-helix transcriptional regulator n=1 Tax=Cohnella sp. LGH TaxID=1619153 RepID=UPI001AD9B147|nr:AraC family transcriptional regulator [Cohnella sp. LGH]QTH40586.1 helix-turn-helix transcriptional regulator [Cohnella sp. LGH]
MKQIYRINENRIIGSANRNVYVNEALHPNRVMKEHDFVYIEEGYWEIYQNDQCYKLYPNDVILLRAGEHHYGLTPCSPNTKTMYLHVNYDEQDHTAMSEGAEGAAKHVELDTVIHCQGSSKVKETFQQIVYTHLSDNRYKNEKLSVLFNLLLLELYEHAAVATNKPNIAERIVEFIHQYPQRFFTAKQLSEEFYLNERTIMKHFKAQYGKSIYVYQLDQKMEAVRLFLLNHPDIKLHEVALNFGFYDEFHLSKTFKKKFNVSPSQYRLQIADQTNE